MKAPGLGDGLYKGGSNFLWLFKNGKFVPPPEQVTNSDISYSDSYGTDVIYYPNQKKPKYLVAPADDKVFVKDIYKKDEDEEVIESIETHEVTFEIEGIFVNGTQFDTREEAESYCDDNSLDYSEITDSWEFEPDFYKKFGDKIYYYKTIRGFVLPFRRTESFTARLPGASGYGIASNYDLTNSYDSGDDKFMDFSFPAHIGNPYSNLSFGMGDWVHYGGASVGYGSLRILTDNVQFVEDDDGNINLYADDFFWTKYNKKGEVLLNIKDFNFDLKYVVRNSSMETHIYYPEAEAESPEVLEFENVERGEYKIINKGSYSTNGVGVLTTLNGVSESDPYLSGVYKDICNIYFLWYKTRYSASHSIGYLSDVVKFYAYRKLDVNARYKYDCYVKSFSLQSDGSLLEDDNFSEYNNGNVITEYSDGYIYSYNSMGRLSYIQTNSGWNYKVPLDAEHNLFVRVDAPGGSPLNFNRAGSFVFEYSEHLVNVPRFKTSWKTRYGNIKHGTFLLNGVRFKTMPNPTGAVVLFDDEGNLVDAESNVWGTLNYLTGDVVFNTPLWRGGAVSYEISSSTEVYLDDYELSEVLIEQLGINNLNNISDFIRDNIYITSKNNLVVVWTATNDETGIAYVKILKEGTTYELTNVYEYGVVGDFVVTFSFKFSTDNEIATFKIFNCITNEITTIIDNTAETGEEEAIYPEFVLADDKYIYIVELYGEYGGIVIKKSDMSYKYITPAWQAENNTGDLLGGYQGKIIARNGIITPNAEGGGTFKPFTTPGDDDIMNQYGGKYFTW